MATGGGEKGGVGGTHRLDCRHPPARIDRQAVGQGQAELAKAITAPKRIVRGKDGRAMHTEVMN